jgi:hypothetical protein
MRGWLLLLLVLASAALIWANGWRPPDRFNPWAPLDLRAPPDLFLRFKLTRLGSDPARCKAALAAVGARFEPMSDQPTGAGGCGWHDAVRLSALNGVTLARPTLLTCPLAASLALFDRQVLQPTARETLGSDVRGIDHVGSYACRNLYSREGSARSRHATAEAIDVTGFRLADGRSVTLADDWAKGEEGVFLRRLQERGCRYFGMILGPDYNPAHRTHFHMQEGGTGFCR